ncbi:MAG: sigma-70 family RNA polymerase sigma factor [Planctomycetes bacterium]|nr:sigma-70 family RNA polymerase sigma factor [Planctomycetota bacterium]
MGSSSHVGTEPIDLDPESLLAHERFLRELVRSLLFDDGHVDDVVQQTWLAAIEHGPRSRAALRSWLGRVAHHAALKIVRSNGRRRAREEIVARTEAVPSTLDILAREAARRGVVEAVLALDEPYRGTMLLRYLDGLPPREVARRLNVPVETVRSRIKHALEVLRARLDREHGGDRRAWGLALIPFAALAVTENASGAFALSCGGSMATKSKIGIGVAAAAIAIVLGWWAIRTPSFREASRPAALAERGAPRDAALPSDAAPPPTEDPPVTTSADAGTSATTGSLDVRVVWSDGSPAAGVFATVFAWIGQDPYRHRIVRQVGADGRLHVDSLPPSKVGVYVDRGGYAEATIEAGKSIEATAEIPAGFDVEGTVVDPDGRPVAGAEIWLTSGGNDEDGLFVARTSEHGSFRLRSIQHIQTVGARAAGFAPSYTRWVEAKVGQTLTLRFPLLRACGAIVGRVLDARSTPVFGATVWVCPESRPGFKFDDGWGSGTTMPMAATSSADGRFEVRDIGVGTHRVYVRVDGLAAWTGDVTVADGATEERLITLLDGVTFAGSVRGADGAPVPRASVSVGATREAIGDARGASQLLESSAPRCTRCAARRLVGERELRARRRHVLRRQRGDG